MSLWPDQRIQDLLGIEAPIIQAPMAGFALSGMVIAVSEAGGLGSLGCAILNTDQVRAELDVIRQRTSRPIAPSVKRAFGQLVLLTELLHGHSAALLRGDAFSPFVGFGYLLLDHRLSHDSTMQCDKAAGEEGFVGRLLYLHNETGYEAGTRALVWSLPIAIGAGAGAASPSYPTIYRAPRK